MINTFPGRAFISSARDYFLPLHHIFCFICGYIGPLNVGNCVCLNGENVSPEGIENKYKENKLVSEVLVYVEKDVIVAEIYPNEEYAQMANITDIEGTLEELTDKLNETALPSHRVERIVIRDTAFEKTSTGKIKRVNNDSSRGDA